MTTAAAWNIRLDPVLIWDTLLLLRLCGSAGRRRLPAEFLQAATEVPIERGIFARIPVAPVTVFTRLVQNLSCIPHRADILPLDDLENGERGISQCLDSRIPFHRVAFDFGRDLSR